MNTLIFCHDESIAEKHEASIEQVAPSFININTLKNPKEDISILLERKRAYHDGHSSFDEQSAFDDIDILIMDESFTKTSSPEFLINEDMVRLIRSWSRCGIIVMMDDRQTHFDLSMLGDLESHADMNINHLLIDKKALWQKSPPEKAQFNPTTWVPLPDLSFAVSCLKNKILSHDFNSFLLEILGIESSLLKDISDRHFAFLSQRAKTVKNLQYVTIQDFINQHWEWSNQIMNFDEGRELRANFIASRLAKWLDLALLRPANILIDEKRMISRSPFMKNHDMIYEFRHDNISDILGRDLFDWCKIRQDKRMIEMQEEFYQNFDTRNDEKLYLAEDTSRLCHRKDVTLFRSGFHNWHDRRYIEKIDNISYGPKRRFAFGDELKPSMGKEKTEENPSLGSG